MSLGYKFLNKATDGIPNIGMGASYWWNYSQIELSFIQNALVIKDIDKQT